MNSDKVLIKADKEYRRNLFLSYLILIIAGILFWYFILPTLISRVENLPNKEHVETMEILSHLFLLLFIPVAIYIIVIGRRMCRHKAVPYPGMKVIRDTVLITGQKATIRGRRLIILGTITIVLTILSIIRTHFITLRFKQHPLFRSYFYQNR
jgi:hypothetical protein